MIAKITFMLLDSLDQSFRYTPRATSYKNRTTTPQELSNQRPRRSPSFSHSTLLAFEKNAFGHIAMNVAELRAEKTDSSNFSRLVDWIVDQHGGTIHDNLESRELRTNQRGIFATKSIAKGETLIVLPASATVSGMNLDSSCNKGGRNASNWLRCIAAYLKAREELETFQPYMGSLPDAYDSLLNWSEKQVSDLLSGTALCKLVSADRNDNVLEQRYKETVRPYLEQHRLVMGPTVHQPELGNFREACMCVSSRGFHLEEEKSKTDGAYAGPFLLPLVDLLNHCPERKCTTLKRDGSKGFYMMAERDIVAGEEIFHSYGSDLTSAQVLQTFGFVPETSMQLAAANNFGTVTPAVLSKADVIRACQSMVKSMIPERVRQHMKTSKLEDESWDLDFDGTLRDLSIISDDLLVDFASPLTDEIITLCALLLLPMETYNDFYAEGLSLLDRSVLEDYYLGKLVCQSIVVAVNAKLETYRPLSLSRELEDKTLLKELLIKNSRQNEQLRATYGLTIRLEEKACLNALRIEALSTIDALESEIIYIPATKKSKHGSLSSVYLD